MDDIERQNLAEVEQLNQRGGRTLSIVDLIKANTVSVEAAGLMLYAVSHGASFFTAAVLGGAGKTTLMASMLGFLAPGTRIVTTADGSALKEAAKSQPKGRVCYLAHEIGAGRWYGYLWGRDVSGFLSLVGPNRQVASCIHADTLEQFYSIMTTQLAVPPALLAKLDLIAFMSVEHSPNGYRRRVAALYEADSAQGQHRLLYALDRKADVLENKAQPSILARLAAAKGKSLPDAKREVGACRQFLERLVAEDEADWLAVRRRVVEFLSASGWV
ncbi:MAG: hypothetical protein FJ279_33170 [Planctomycetes bacterium]|nr:hypothetical protein [Planctomycetota bacterium]